MMNRTSSSGGGGGSGGSGSGISPWFIYLVIIILIGAIISLFVMNYVGHEAITVSVDLASTHAIDIKRGTLPRTMDGQPIQQGYNLLLRHQMDDKQNGVYHVESKSKWTMRNSDLSPDQTVYVRHGEENEGKAFSYMKLSDGGRLFPHAAQSGLPEAPEPGRYNGVLVNGKDTIEWSQNVFVDPKQGYASIASAQGTGHVLNLTPESIRMTSRIDPTATPDLILQSDGGVTHIGGSAFLDTLVDPLESRLAYLSPNGEIKEATLVGLTLSADGTLEVSAGAGGVTEHGELKGLSDDDHTQYHNDTRADTWLSTKDTGDLTEGTNLYYTQARFDTAFTAKDTDDLSEGLSNFYYTQARFDTSLATKDTGDLTEGDNLYYTQDRFNTAFTAKNTNDLSEGLTNFYYTEARFDTSLATKDTGDLTEGANLYYTQDRFNTAFTAKDTDDLSEGLTNFYYTEARFDTSLATKDTGDLTEGANLYWTTARITGTANQVIVTPSGDNVVLTTPQNLDTNANVQFNDVSVNGNLIISGTTTTVNSDEVDVKDNIIVLNAGEIGAGVTNGTAGIQVDRGSSTDYQFVFNESLDTFQIGEVGSLQDVCTRTGTMNDQRIPLYNTATSSFTINATTDHLPEGSNLYYTQARFDTAFGTKTTSDLTEGTNLYWTTSRIDGTANQIIVTDDLDGTITLSAPQDLSQTDTPTFGGLIVDGTSAEAFLIRVDDDGGDVFVVNTTNQRVGINTSAPTQALDVVGTCQVSGRITLGTTSDLTPDLIMYGNPAGFGATYFNMDGDFDNHRGIILYNFANDFLSFGTANAVRMTLDSSGNLGFGTNTPSARVHAISTTEQLRLAYDGSNYASFTTGSGGDFTIAPSGGDTNITGKCHVSSRITMGTISHVTPDLIMYGNPAGFGAVYFNMDEDFDNHRGLIIYNFASDTLTFGTANAGRMTIDSSGNLGVGTATPSARVHAISTTEQLRLGYDGSNYASFTTDSAGDLTINTSGSGNVTIVGGLDVDTDTLFVDASTDRVGVNTASPSSELHIVGSARLEGTNDSLLFYNDDGTSQRGYIQNRDTILQISSISSTLSLRSNTAGQDVDIYAGGTQALLINGTSQNVSVLAGDFAVDTDTLFVDASTNRVGINTSSPAVPLHVISTNTQLYLGYDNTDHASFRVLSGGDMIIQPSGNDLTLFCNVQSTASITCIDFEASGTGTIDGDLAVDTDTLFVDASTDRVGINNSSPDSVFHITSSQPIITVQDTNGTQGLGNLYARTSLLDSSGTLCGYIGYGGNERLDIYQGNNSEIRFFTAATEKMTLTNGGRLDIKPSLDNNVHLGVNNAAGNWRCEIGTWVSGGGFQRMKNAAGTNTIYLDTEGSSYFNGGDFAVNTDTMFVDASTNRVGINTSSPAVPLHVISTNTQLHLGYDNTDHASFRVLSGGDMIIQPSGNDLTLFCNVQSTASITCIDFEASGTGTIDGDLAVDTDTLFVDASTDRVGINNSSPSYDLDVSGNAYISSTIRVQQVLPITTTSYLTNINSVVMAASSNDDRFMKFRGGGSSVTGRSGVLYANFDSSHFSVYNESSALNWDYSSTASGGTALGPPRSAFSNLMSLSSTGVLSVDTRVEIGTITDSVSDMRIYTATSGIGRIFFNDGSDQGYIYYSHSANDMYFGTSGTTRMTLDSNGDLGIGIANPDSDLHLYRNAGVADLRVEGPDARILIKDTDTAFSTSTPGMACNLNFLDSSGSYIADIGYNSEAGIDNTGDGFFIRTRLHSDIVFWAGTGTNNDSLWSMFLSADDQSVNIQYDLAVDTDTLFVDASTDRVGINNSSPSEALDVVGTVHVKSKIVFEENGGREFEFSYSATPEFITQSITDAKNWRFLSPDNTQIAKIYFADSGGGMVIGSNTSNPPAQGLLVGGDTSITGDLAVDTDTLFVDASTNSVGFNTTSPTGLARFDMQDADYSSSRKDIKVGSYFSIGHSRYQVKPYIGFNAYLSTSNLTGDGNLWSPEYSGDSTAAMGAFIADAFRGDLGYYTYPCGTDSTARDLEALTPLIYFDVSAESVGIGTSSPAYQLELSTDSAGKPSTNTWTIVSDQRIKKDIEDFTDGLDKILAMQPRYYKYNGKGGTGYEETKDRHIGFVAQEVEQVADYLVSSGPGKIEGKDIRDFRRYHGHALPFIMINAFKEIKFTTNDLEQENADLKSQLTEQRSQLTEQQSQLHAQQLMIEQLLQRITALENTY